MCHHPPQNPYLLSALRKFEHLNSAENTPVRTGSNLTKRKPVKLVKPKNVSSSEPHVEDEVETSRVKPAEQQLKTPAYVPVKDIVEKPIEKPVEEPLKTHADTPKTDWRNLVKTVEESLKTPTDVPVENIVVKPAEESLKTDTETSVEETGKTLVDGASTDQIQSSGALQETTLHENQAKPTENKEDNTEQVTIAQSPVVEAPLKPRQVENQPTSDHGELSLVSALETPITEPSTRATTELTEEPPVAALEEHNRLNCEAELNVKDKTMCSFCKLPLDENGKISINIPAICCHPDCFKCNGCWSPLGDLSSSLYYYAGKILCEKCFDQICSSDDSPHSNLLHCNISP
ncbi:zinc finger protein 185-like [Cyprinus carpio]|uniref:Zinc finger protein 185-like n=1 Tax=Cyprinus carpio TaxID=7962 RepID=A0A9Q9Y455_CYPCA|nr:zinc finger protein 185-like [Cyprinus carpio]